MTEEHPDTFKLKGSRIIVLVQRLTFIDPSPIASAQMSNNFSAMVKINSLAPIAQGAMVQGQGIRLNGSNSTVPVYQLDRLQSAVQ